MKLKTVMAGPDSTSEGPYPSADDDGQALLHDAAAAHALMMAMADLDHMDWSRKRNPVTEIQSLATALMAEWGFDTQDRPA